MQPTAPLAGDAADTAPARPRLPLPVNLTPAAHPDDDECGCVRLDNGECGCISDRIARVR